MLETFLLAFILAKFKGYKLKPLLKCWALYPLFIFEIIAIVFNISTFMGNYEFLRIAHLCKTIYMCLFLIPIFKYKNYIYGFIGAICIFIGTGLNNFVISANNGKMPVFPSISYLTGYIRSDFFEKINNTYNDIHILGDSNTNYKFLTDYIDVGYSILSIGDVFIRVFAFIVIYTTIKEINKESTVKCS